MEWCCLLISSRLGAPEETQEEGNCRSRRVFLDSKEGVPCQGPLGSARSSGGGAGTRLSHLFFTDSGGGTQGRVTLKLEPVWPLSSFSCKGMRAEEGWEGWRVEPEEETQATAVALWLENDTSGHICGCVPRGGVVLRGAWIQPWPCYWQLHDLGQAVYLYMLVFCKMGLSLVDCAPVQ